MGASNTRREAGLRRLRVSGYGGAQSTATSRRYAQRAEHTSFVPARIATRPRRLYVDTLGVERATELSNDPIAKLRRRFAIVDRLFALSGHYSSHGGVQHSAAITCFSLLCAIPILMGAFSAAGFVLVSQPDLAAGLATQITHYVSGAIADEFLDIVYVAIAQRITVLGFGAAAVIWAGLHWMRALRSGLSRMWNRDPRSSTPIRTVAGDLLSLVGLLLILIIAFAATTVRIDAILIPLLRLTGLSNSSAISTLVELGTTGIALLTHFIALMWITTRLPRGGIPARVMWRPVLVFAILLEIIKRLAGRLAVALSHSPAGIAFGPVVTVMVLIFISWQIVLLCAAWAASSTKTAALVHAAAPVPAHVQVVTVATQPQRNARTRCLGAVLPGILSAVATFVLCRRWR